MKNILLTTTAIVAFAGAAAADGHTSFTWGGAATAGIAREGGSPAVAGTMVTASFDTQTLANDLNAIEAATVVPATVTPTALRIAIANEIERLCQLSDENWLEIQDALLPRLEHNFNLVTTDRIDQTFRFSIG